MHEFILNWRHVLALACLVMGAVLPAAAAPVAPQVMLLTVNGAVGPASADYVSRGIDRAASAGSALVILQMDTPGGLDTSMRSIIRAILASPVPVASYVAPGGARAASAGTYILYASHFAAMAPGTNLGAATPVQLGAAGSPPAADKAPDSALARKQVNDAAAYIRGLAQLRGRNADWAERAVRDAVSLPAQEALKLGVINDIAADTAALAARLDGRKALVQGQERVLHTAGAVIVDARPDWRARLLAVITSPGIALLLMTAGVYGLVFEFISPGAVAPGVIGAICLLLALYGLQLLPVNYAGLALILLALMLMVVESFVPSFGVLGLGGVVAFVAGALMLIDTDLPAYGIAPGLIVAVALVSALLFTATTTIVLKTRRRKAVAGLDDMVGSIAEIESSGAAPHEAWAHLRGETWRVVSSTPLQPCQKVRVVARRGLLLEVVPAGSDQQGGKS